MFTVCFTYTRQGLKSPLLFLLSSFFFFPRDSSNRVCFSFVKEKRNVSSMIRPKSFIESELSISLPLHENLRLDFSLPTVWLGFGKFPIGQALVKKFPLRSGLAKENREHYTISNWQLLFFLCWN